MGPGPWAHGPMISAYFGLFGLISVYLETDSCLFQIIWTLISAYFGLSVYESGHFKTVENHTGKKTVTLGKKLACKAVRAPSTQRKHTQASMW